MDKNICRPGGINVASPAVQQGSPTVINPKNQRVGTYDKEPSFYVGPDIGSLIYGCKITLFFSCGNSLELVILALISELYHFFDPPNKGSNAHFLIAFVEFADGE